jgi:hypothetical protein
MSSNPRKPKNSQGSGNYSRNDLLVAALARGSSIAKAAREAGYSERQAYRKTRSLEFQAEVTRVRTELFDRAYGRLTQATGNAVQTLCRLLNDGSPAIQLAAARSLLDFSGRFREAMEMTQRLERIEDHLRRKDTSGWQHQGPN